MALKRWSIASFSTSGGTVPETKTLMIAEASKETILLSMFFSNYDGVSNAELSIVHSDGTNTLFQFPLVAIDANASTSIDSKWVLEPGDKIEITSDIDAVSILASGDVS